MLRNACLIVVLRTSDQIVKDRQSAQKRMSNSRASRTSDQIVKDRQSAQKRLSGSRASRTSDQIVKDRQSAQKRLSGSRASRTSDQIVKDRQSAQKRLSGSRASRTSDQIVKDRQSAQKRLSGSRASRTSDQIVKDRQSAQKRLSGSRASRTSDQIVKDRQSAQKRISDSRASRTSDQIVKDRQSAQKRMSDSRASRTSDQIVKDRQKDQKCKSNSRASRTSDNICKDRQTDKKHRSEKRANRTSDQIVKDRQSDHKSKSECRSKRSAYQIVKERQSDQKSKSECRSKRSAYQIVKERQSDQKSKSECRSKRSTYQIVKDRQSDQKRKSECRSKRSTYQIVKDRQSEKQRKVQKRKIVACELVIKDRQKDRKRKTASRRNRTSDQILKDKKSDKNRKSHYRENRDEAQIRAEKDKEAQRWQMRQKYKFASVDEQKRYENFKREIQFGPIYPCNICHRTFTRNGVLELSEKYISKLNSKCSGLYQTVAEGKVFMNDKQYICLTCNRWLMHKQKIPPLSVKNGLTIENIPCELDLSELSNVLIAKNIIFLKLFKLPKSRWSALKDKIINVPITDDDILKTLSELTSLPRLPDQAGLIPVQLKRKVSYKSAVQEAYIDPQKLITAVAKLKELGHPGYTAVNLPNNYLTSFNRFLKEDNNYNHEESMENIETDDNQEDKPQHEQNTGTEDNKDVDSGQDTPTDSNRSIDKNEEDEDDIHSDLDPIYQKQSNIQSATVMSNSFPEVSIIEPANTQHDIDSTESHAIAPGEGKIPSNLMRDKLWDVNAFPSFHPTGKFGLHHQRDIKLQPQQYFVQRLQNVNKRFSSCPPYVFAAQYYIERQQLEQNINISYLKGRVSGGNLLELHDSFAVFEKIPGTPKYWLNKRYELLAKLENLGAFQFFFTLSMADMRWPEIVTSVLAQEGKHIEYNSSKYDDPSIITINGEPFEDYVKRESIHELVKNNVLMATRCFDQRVKAFIKHIIQGKNSPMCVKYFNYRVEFQLRGAGHIHGVLWINVDQMEKMLPGITLALTSLRLHEQLSEKQCDLLADFVDKFTCCSLQNEVSEIVRQVQIHKHSRTCSKYGMTCRFSYPKFPSKKTIIAQPLSKTDFESDAKYKATVSKYTATLDSVRKVLGNLEEDKLASYSVNDVLNLAKVNEKDYEKALSVSSVGTTIVMKRAVDEIYVNNYNPEWIRAWNGNMDLQVCLDYHAVITYITDYYTKDESGTMNFLKQAARENSHKDRTELMRLLSQVFLTHRQNGECEAYYKIFPNLHLTDSNVKTVFVATNFPDQRYKFLVKVSDNQNAPATGIENEPENETEEIDLEPEPIEPGSLISVAGKEGKFTAKTSVHERYTLRPTAIENICLAQFATLYETCSKISAKAVLFANNTRGESTHKLICSDIRDVFLPNYIKLSDETYMKIRSYPAVLRKHKFRMDTQYHEFLFSDLLLYTPWRKESSLYYHNFDKCLKLYESKREYITFVQETLFPHMNTVQESQLLFETASDHRSTHIGDVINPQHEQDQEEQALLGVEEDENYASRHPGELFDREEIMQPSANRNIYRRIDISDKDSMAGMVQQLDCHQRRVFDTVIKYCKDLRKSVQSRANVPDPPLLLVHGGAGSGKSTLIHAISVWAESILRTSDNRHPDYPLIIRNAPTGTAASNISGLTIHSSFNLRFGNSFNSLPDKQRDTQRNILSYLQILIIDEISMMKADMLYQLNLRLQEIKQNKNDFGGISVLLFGDIMQLRPVKARWIFDEPSNPQFALSYSVRSLWELFQVVELKINHRQGDDHDYADLLNRVRLGKHTENDIQILQSRVRNQFPPDAIHLYGKNRNVYEYNEDKLTELQGVEYTIMAQNIHPARANYEPKISKEGLVNDSPFLNKLKIKETARIMLIYNIDTGDGLTNGALGEIVQINTKERNEVKDLLIRFDNPDIGKQLRKAHHIQDDLTPIGKISFSYSLGSIKKGHAATAKVVQFPLRLAWAVTVHKFQGQTVKPPASLVGHMESIFDKGQAYVLLGRVQSLSQLYLSSCSAEMIKVWPEALEQVTKLADRAINNTETLWQSNKTNCFRMAALNTRSLNRHFHDITCDSTLMLCDFICLSETWAVTEEDDFNIEDFSLYTCGSGRGKGVAVYSRKEHTLLHSAAFESSDYQILHLQYPHIELTIVYISPSSRSHADIAEKLKSVITHNKTSVVCGDFNTDFNKLPDSIVSKTLQDMGFQQVITDSTYIEGSLLDHMYSNAEPELQFVHPAYFSDHDATCLLIPKF